MNKILDIYDDICRFIGEAFLPTILILGLFYWFNGYSYQLGYKNGLESILNDFMEMRNTCFDAEVRVQQKDEKLQFICVGVNQ